MKVTLKEIAAALDVSITTVSRALKNQGRIGESTRQRIIEKAQEMGYEMRIDASNASCLMVGIVFGERLQSLATDPFYGIVMMGVEKVCQEYHSQVFFHTIEHPTENRLWKLHEDQRLHGLIIVGGDISHEFVEAVAARGIPFVLVDNCLANADVDAIVTDNAGGMRKVMEHLFAFGHHRIGFVGGPLAHPSLAERYDTYRECMLNSGVAIEDKWSWIHSEAGPTFDKGYQAIRELAADGLGVTALVSDNDNTAIGILKGCTELGVKVPEQLSIVGFDNIIMAEHVSPGITSVHIHKMQMGEWAAKRIHQLMAKEDIAVKISLATALVERGSTGQCQSVAKRSGG